jgi:hypothetical protein
LGLRSLVTPGQECDAEQDRWTRWQTKARKHLARREIARTTSFACSILSGGMKEAHHYLTLFVASVVTAVSASADPRAPIIGCPGEPCFSAKGVVGTCEHNEYLRVGSDKVGATGVELVLLSPTWTEVLCRGEKSLTGKAPPEENRVWVPSADAQFCGRLRGKVLRGSVAPYCEHAAKTQEIQAPRLATLSDMRW